MATGVGLGTVIGLERQYRARMAGLRTNALVAAGATLFVLLDVVAGQTSELVSQTERDALAAALRERLADVPAYHGSAGSCLAYVSGFVLDTSPAALTALDLSIESSRKANGGVTDLGIPVIGTMKNKRT